MKFARIYIRLYTYSGCYNESTLESKITYKDNLTTMAPGFCQEICLNQNISLFAVQVFIIYNGFWTKYTQFYSHQLFFNFFLFNRQAGAFVFQVILTI